MKRIFSVVLSCALLLGTAGLALAERGNPNAVPGPLSQETYNIIKDEFVYIPMRDGTMMHAWVYLPEGEGPWPTIMEGSPYGTMTVISGETYAKRGYAWVNREVRGRFMSEGDFDDTTMHMDRDDYWDTVEWIINQPWSNGKVGAQGGSYPGQAALQAALSGHPNLLCASASVTSANVWRDGWYYRGGAMEYGFITNWITGALGTDMAEKRLSGVELENWKDDLAMYSIDSAPYIDVVPAADFSLAQMGDFNIFKNWVAHPSFDSYWAERSFETFASSVSIPMLHFGGWYDMFQNGTFASYTDVAKSGLTEHARDNQRLFINGESHVRYLTAYTIEPGPNHEAMNFADVRLAFMDYWLKDIQSPLFDPDKPVVYYTNIEDEWKYAEQWPLPEVEYANYYLRPEASGSIASLYDGSIGPDKPTASQDPISYDYDPMTPLPTLLGNMTGMGGNAVQNYVDERSLTFTSAPLTDPVEITGKVRAILYISSSAVDTDFVVRVCDVYPDGTSINVVDGIQRARYRDSSINPTLMEPGEIYTIEVDLWSTSHLFQPGHSIRVVVNSSSFPKWSRNMNVAEQPELATEWVTANNTIYLDVEHPSHVILPVIPR